jgi:hypothetical protein
VSEVRIAAVVLVLLWVIGQAIAGEEAIERPSLDAPAYVVEPAVRVSVPNP